MFGIHRELTPIPLSESRPGLFWEIRDYVMICIGTLLYAGGVSLFMLPYGLTTGGIAGVSSIIYYATGLPVSVSYGCINLVFLTVAVKVLGWKFCFKTIAGVASSTLWFSVCQYALTSDTGVWPMVCGDQSFMACILGPIVCGIGLSLCFESHGSTGGTDIIAAIINKYREVSLGQIILLCDILIISSCYFVFHDIQRVIFGYVIMVVVAVTLDYCTRRTHQAVELKIFSRNYSAIADAINQAGFGLTVIDGQGWYTRTERKMLICICSKRYQNIVMKVIKGVDPFCFVSVSNVSDVYGEGFSTMKTIIKNQKPIIVIATDNLDKLTEMRSALGDKYEIRSLKQIGCRKTEIRKVKGDILQSTKDEARYVHRYYGFDCIADNTENGKMCIVLLLKGQEYIYSDIQQLYDKLGQIES